MIDPEITVQMVLDESQEVSRTTTGGVTECESFPPGRFLKTVAGEVLVSKQLLAGRVIKMTETDTGLVVECTIDDVLFDMISGAHKYVHEMPSIGPKPGPSRWSRLRQSIGSKMAEWSWRIAGGEPDDDWWGDD